MGGREVQVRTTLSLAERRLQRALEITPGVLTWIIILAPVVASLFFAGYVATAIVVLDVYWFIRSFLVVRGIVRTYRQMRQTMAVNWWQRCLDLPSRPDRPDPKAIIHAVLIPTYTEPYQVLRATVRAIADANYPTEGKIVAMITRKSDRAGGENVSRLQAEFGSRLRGFFHIEDPLLPGIVVGKSAAMAYGGPRLKRELDALRLNPEQVIVTDLDSDFRVHTEYFAYVSYQYALEPQRLEAIFQPIPMFHNNLWRVPTAVRVMASACTQWQMFLESRPDRLVAFSSYSTCLALVARVGYWDDDVIPEDSRFYWKCFFATAGRLRMKPTFLPIYGDAPRARDYKATHISQYNQIKRWAWGVSDLPYVTLGLLRHPEIPFALKARRYGYMVFNHLSWTTMPILLLFGASIPRLLSLDWMLTERAELLGMLAFALLNITLLNVTLLIGIEAKLNPPRPRQWNPLRRAWSYAQLATYPIVGLFLSVLPALEAQTRLMLGMYLEYRVTEKVTEGTT